MVGGAVVVGDVHPQEKLRRTETGLELAVAVAALHVEEAVAQQYGNGVVSIAEEAGHVVGVVIDRPAVFTPERGKLAVAHPLSVDAHLIMAQTADIDGGGSDAAVGVEFAPQDDAAGRQRIDSFPFGLERVFFENLVAPPSVRDMGVAFGDSPDPAGSLDCGLAVVGQLAEAGRHHMDHLFPAPFRPVVPSLAAALFALVSDSHVPGIAVRVGGQRGDLHHLALAGKHHFAVVDEAAGHPLVNFDLVSGLADGPVGVLDVLPAQPDFVFHKGHLTFLVIAAGLCDHQFGLDGQAGYRREDEKEMFFHDLQIYKLFHKKTVGMVAFCLFFPIFVVRSIMSFRHVNPLNHDKTTFPPFYPVLHLGPEGPGRD